MSDQPKSEMLFTRLSPAVKAKFIELATELGLTGSDVLRLLVDALIDGRVTIIPPTTQKASIHVPRSID